MEFSINFVCSGKNVLETKRVLTRKDVAYIRQEVGVEKLPWKRINEYAELHVYRHRLYVELEEHFQAIPQFEKCCYFEVVVPPKYLNQFTYESLAVKRNPETGEVLNVEIVVCYSNDEILDAWIADGCPDKWGFEDTEA